MSAGRLSQGRPDKDAIIARGIIAASESGQNDTIIVLLKQALSSSYTRTSYKRVAVLLIHWSAECDLESNSQDEVSLTASKRSIGYNAWS
jgi:hypothetical protein